MKKAEEAREHVRKAIASGLIPHIGKGRIDNTLYMIPDKGKLLGRCFCCHCCCLTDAFNHLPPEYRNRLFPRIEEIRMEVTDDCTGCETCVE
jgi:UDP-glucose 4-epimerase